MSNYWGGWKGVTPVDGLKIYGNSLDRRIYAWLHAKHWMGHEEMRTLQSLLKPGFVVVDAGANIGLYSAVMGRLVTSSGRVISFEPVPRVFACLEQNALINKLDMIEAHNAALGDAEGSYSMRLSSYNSGDNRPVVSGGTLTKMVRGDDIVGDRVVDFIKMDVQGFELPALKGLEKTVLSSRDLLLFFEYWPHGMERAGFSPDEFVDWLADRSFSLNTLSPDCKLQPIDWHDADRYCTWSLWGAYGTFVACRE